MFRLCGTGRGAGNTDIMSEYKGRPGNKVGKHHMRGASAVCGLLLLCGSTVIATPPPQGIAPVLVPAGGFGLDGDLSASSGVGDWLGGTNASSGVLSAAGVPLNPATTFHFVDPYSTSADTTFVGGLKWTDDPNVWQW